MNVDISVVIPLYNKEREIAATLRSVLAQTLLPAEIIVVDDGSTDGSAAAVLAVESPLIRLISQPNAGVSAARNRGAQEAAGRYVAFLDADDTWEPQFIETIARLINQYPDCGVYATGFRIVRHGRGRIAKSPKSEGVVVDFFRESMSRYICTSSSVAISKADFMAVGGFPEGMKMGEDLFLWIKLGYQYPVCFTPSPLANYMVSASNRSAKTYTSEKGLYSFAELYRTGKENFWLNEYIARCAIGKAITLSAKGNTSFGCYTVNFFAYTHHYRRGLRRLRLLNRLPRSLRPVVNNTFNTLARIVAGKGF
jgi:glycosyltransferase involved in cell wall biosynthesis